MLHYNAVVCKNKYFRPEAVQLSVLCACVWKLHLNACITTAEKDAERVKTHAWLELPFLKQCANYCQPGQAVFLFAPAVCMLAEFWGRLEVH